MECVEVSESKNRVIVAKETLFGGEENIPPASGRENRNKSWCDSRRVLSL